MTSEEIAKHQKLFRELADKFRALAEDDKAFVLAKIRAKYQIKQVY